MKKRYLFLALFCFILNFANAQVGIGTTIPDVSSELDISSPLNNKGVLIPRMTQAQRNLIASPAISLLIYQIDNTPGFYYYNGTIWVGITAGASTDWTLLGNAGTSAATNFFGTTDDVDIVLKRNNIRAGYLGKTLASDALGLVNRRNTSFGTNSLLTPATGYRNTAIGTNVMTVNGSGNRNVAVGDAAMSSNTNGQQNVAVGVGALFTNQLGNSNVAIGRNALTLTNGTTGTQASNNTAVGMVSMELNTTGAYNSAFGRESLYNNTTGDYNVGVGWKAGFANSVGINNVSIGNSAGLGSTGSNNITIGSFSEVPVLANSDQLSIGNVIYGTTMTSTAAGKIGIGEGNPNAKLQITSSNQASPAITDGVIIPKVDNLAATPTAAQEGMLVYLNAISGTNQPGFYYWDNDIPSWVGLNSTVNGDHDWYKVGTTTAPTAITDDMFHIGNVAIGKNTANHSLDIETTSTDNSISILQTNNSNNVISGSRIIVNGTGTNNHYGNFNTLSGAGTGFQTGVFNVITNSSDSDHFGNQNLLLSDGNGKHIGTRNELGGTGTGNHIGIENLLNGSASSFKTGFRNSLSDSSASAMTNYAILNTITSNSSGDKIGVINNVNANNSGIITGVENTLSSINANVIYGTRSTLTGNLDMYGNRISLINNGTSGLQTITGSDVNISGTTASAVKGTDTQISTSGNSAMYGNYTSITSTASGTGPKYGSLNLISSTAGGTHYGVYSEVLKAGATNFAGYFLGNVGIGTTAANIYTLPASRGTNLQIMQSNATGGVTWQNPSTALNSAAWLTTGNSGMTANFLGTTDANPLAFRANNTERMRIVPTGEVVIGATIPGFTGDTFGVISPSGGFAINGYASGTGTGVYAETGTGNGVWGQGATGVGVRGQSTGTGIGVAGFNSGTGIAVLGNNSGGGTGVDGRSVLTGIGVSGTNTGTGIAIQGINSGTGNGVVGQSTSTAFGVLGTNSGTGNGVRGTSASTGIGVIGFNSATGVGVQGQSVTSGFGVLGFNTGTGVGIQGQNSSTGPAVVGLNTGTGNGVVGQSTSTAFGVLGTNSGTGNGVRGTSASTGIGVIGFNSATGVGVQGQNSSTGLAIFGANTSTGIGVLGQTPVGSTSFAVFANGNMGASGTKPFYIDHPTDPENKYLRHFALESNEVLNVYRGNVILDSNGEAIVTLPNYFDEVNKNFSYNLTSIGSRSEVFIKDEIANNQFKIAGGNPNQKISWQVYAERNDLYLQKYPENRKVEVDKNNNDRGKYLMPELFNQSKEKGIFNSSVNEIEPNTSNNSSLKSGIVISPKNEELNVSKQTINTPEANTTFAKKEKKTK